MSRHTKVIVFRQCDISPGADNEIDQPLAVWSLGIKRTYIGGERADYTINVLDQLTVYMEEK